MIGASRGLGAAIAKTLAAEGATVIAAARRVEAIDGWIAEIPADIRGRVEAAQLDLSVVESVDGLCDPAARGRWGRHSRRELLWSATLAEAREAKREDWLVHFEAMAANLFHLTQRLVPPMAQRGWGRIVTIASSGVEQPIPRLALSNGIRSAVMGWSKTLASEVAAQGITVNVVLPGRIHTERVDQLDRAAADRSNASVEAVAKASMASIPVGRYGRS